MGFKNIQIHLFSRTLFRAIRKNRKARLRSVSSWIKDLRRSIRRSYYLSLCIFLGLGLGSLSAQVSLHLQSGGGLLLIQGDIDQHDPGFQVQTGLSVEGAIPYLRDLTWEIGAIVAYAQADLYRIARGNQTVINRNYKTDRSTRFIHKFGTIDLPLQLRYNAFGFMGLTAGISFSYMPDWAVTDPQKGYSNQIYPVKRDLISVANTGLFFPVNDRIRINLEGYLPVGARFYNSVSELNGRIVYSNPYRDYTILTKVAYRLIGN